MTFLTDVMKKGYSEEEIFAVLGESEQDRKSRRVLAKVTETAEAHRLQQMTDLLILEKIVTWRRMNGFDRVADGEDHWFHSPRSLPPTPEEFAADLWCEVNALKDAISMPAWTRLCQKTTKFVDGLKGKLPNEELAVIKRYVEKRSREAAQMTVTPVDTVQYCSPCQLNPEMPPDVCMRLESNEGKMDPELKELESPSASTGLEMPGQQYPPNEGTWEKGRTIADGYLLVGMRSTTAADISSPTEHVGTRAGTAATPAKRRHKTTSEENRQFDPGGKEEKPPPWNAVVILLFLFLGGSLSHGRPAACTSCFCLCVLLPCSLIIVHFR